MEDHQPEQTKAAKEREGHIGVGHCEVDENVSGDDGDEKLEFHKPRVQSNLEQIGQYYDQYVGNRHDAYTDLEITGNPDVTDDELASPMSSAAGGPREDRSKRDYRSLYRGGRDLPAAPGSVYSP